MPYDHADSPATLVQKAADTGRVVYYPKDNELILDLDSGRVLEYALEQFKMLEQQVPGVKMKTWPSKTGGHYHALVTMPRNVHPWERIALQAALGSDRKKELISCMYQTNGMPSYTVLFEDPHKL